MVYIRIPFGESGDRTEVPAESVGGAVSFDTGYGPQYSQDPSTSGTARRIERNIYNGFAYRVSSEIQQYQQFGVPEYILPAQNNNTAFPYSIGALVRYNPTDGTTTGADTRVYRSFVNNNTNLPTVATAWTDVTGFQINTLNNSGLGGGGDLTANRALFLDINNLVTATPTGSNEMLFSVSANGSRKTTINTFLSTFVNATYINGLTGVDADTLGGQTPQTASLGNSIARRHVNGELQCSFSIVDNSIGNPAATILVASAVVGQTTLMGRRGISDVKSDMDLQNLTNNLFTGNLTVSGRVTGTVGVTSNSDERLKREVGKLDAEDSLKAVLGWRKVYARFNDKSQELFGTASDMQVAFYSQDVKQTHPAMVVPIEDANGKATEYNSLAYDRTPVVLASAMEALVDRISQLEKRISELEGGAA